MYTVTKFQEEVPMNDLKASKVNEFLKDVLGTYTEIFSVKYIKRTDGSERKHRCFRKVQKHLKGGERAYDFDEKNLVGVWIPEEDRRENDRGNGYRAVPAENIIEVRAGGKVFQTAGGHLIQVKT